MRRTEAGRTAIPKDYKPLYEVAAAAGWRVFFSGSNHLLWYPPQGQGRVTTALSPSSSSMRKVRCQLRRLGLQV